jgi:hypothetical protein
LKKDDILTALSGDWKRPFRGGSLDLLRELLPDEEKAFDEYKFYAKSITILQSSGTGKSRLVDELGKEFLAISFVLRHHSDDTTWPPGDHEITKFLTRSTSYEKLTAGVVALLSATLAQGNEFPVTRNNGCCDRLTVCIPVTEWFSGETQFDQMKDLAKSFHDKMAPMDPDRTETTSQAELRSPFRISFIKRTVEAAEQLYLELINHPTWKKDHREPFYMSRHELVRSYLIQRARKLTDNLNQRYQVSGDTEADATTCISSGGSRAATKPAKQLLLFVFDEVANLWVTTDGKKTGNPFYALRRVLGNLKNIPIWSLLLSTQPTPGALFLPRELDSSNRMPHERLSTLEPFLGLQLDVAAEEAVSTKEGFEEERKKPMSQFATVKHMTMFGRSLWRAYRNVSPSSLRDFALTKLTHNIGYDAENKHHVFAALASRLCLDVCTKEAEAIALAHEAVNSYLRIIISIDTSEKSNSENPLQRMETVTPSEPIVAEIVAEELCKGTNWSSSISILANLLNRGLVEKGLKGELFARLLCILARLSPQRTSSHRRLIPIFQTVLRQRLSRNSLW